MENIWFKIKDEQSGISLILSMVILMAIFGLVIVVSDIAFDIQSTNKSVGSSEIALFAAESAAEMTIYELEKIYREVRIDLPPIADQVIALPKGQSAVWNREVKLSTSTPGLCSPADSSVTPSPVCSDNPGVINDSNPLRVNLLPGQSFQMDLDIKNATTSYPNHVEVTLPGTNSVMIVSGVISGDYQQVTHVTGVTDNPGDTIILPYSGNLRLQDNYKFKIMNETGSSQSYTITTQTGNDELPLGIEIRAWGKYLDTERNITLIRPAWLLH